MEGKYIHAPTNKIPGVSMPLAKKENHVKDLSKLTYAELWEIKVREGRILERITLVNLPDKGKRIKDFYEKVLAELERRASIDDAAKMFSVLNIADKGERAMNKMEWQGHLKDEDLAADAIEDVLDSDDETEMDPLRMIAQRTMHERRIRILKPEEKLITPQDLEEINSFAATSNNAAEKTEKEKPTNSISSATSEGSCSSKPEAAELEQHVLYLVEHTEQRAEQANPVEKYKPYKTTKSDVHNPEKERLRKQGKHWENTAATPPAIQHNGTQMLTLLDSVEIQTNYLSKLKELQEKQASERMEAKLKRLDARKTSMPSSEEMKRNAAFTKYRDVSTKLPDIEGNRALLNNVVELHDPLDEDKPGGHITYSFADFES